MPDLKKVANVEGEQRALTPEHAKEVIEQAYAGMPKADLARAYGTSREPAESVMQVKAYWHAAGSLNS